MRRSRVLVVEVQRACHTGERRSSQHGEHQDLEEAKAHVNPL